MLSLHPQKITIVPYTQGTIFHEVRPKLQTILNNKQYPTPKWQLPRSVRGKRRVGVDSNRSRAPVLALPRQLPPGDLGDAVPATVHPRKARRPRTQNVAMGLPTVDGCIWHHEMKPWLKPLVIIPGILRWCEMDFVHPQYLPLKTSPQKQTHFGPKGDVCKPPKAGKFGPQALRSTSVAHFLRGGRPMSPPPPPPPPAAVSAKLLNDAPVLRRHRHLCPGKAPGEVFCPSQGR